MMMCDLVADQPWNFLRPLLISLMNQYSVWTAGVEKDLIIIVSQLHSAVGNLHAQKHPRYW